MSFTRIIKIAAALALILACSVGASAQSERENAGRDRIMAELKPYKHDFLIKDLKLSKEQSKEFFPVYDQMDEELMKINEETRELERKTEDNAEASDTEVEAAARATFEQKQREGEVEMKYYDQFKEILTPRQLLRLKGAERRYTQWLVRHHRKLVRERN